MPLRLTMQARLLLREEEEQRLLLREERLLLREERLLPREERLLLREERLLLREEEEEERVLQAGRGQSSSSPASPTEVA